MLIKRCAILLLVLSVLIMAKEIPAQMPASASTSSVAPDINYTVSMSKPWTHLLEVEMRVRWNQMPQQLGINMPVWTPGSYLIREYARHVQDFEAKSGTGSPLTWRKTDKNTWQIDSIGAKEIVAAYRVYANELTVRTNELNDEHAFWNNAGLLMFPTGQLHTSSTVTIKPYDGWKIATGLPRAAGSANTFRAENYDILYDSPFEVSNFHEISFTVEGKQHRIIFSGEGNYDMQKTAADLAKVVEQAYKIFGELPYNDYTFIVNLRGGGGLEHLNSTALQYDRFGFRPEASYKPEVVSGSQLNIPRQRTYKDFLGLAAHEYFHTFNVKRIRPDALGPFDYENENYTKLLWLAEGGTEYYSNLLLLRAGLITDKEYLETMATVIGSIEALPGRLQQSVEEASFDAWIKYYRPDENSVNNQISYYDKGEIVNMMLDISIRGASQGRRSLDDVLRTLYTDFYKKGRNYTPEDVQRIAGQMAGRNLDDFFTRYVRGRDQIDYNSIVSNIGLTLNGVEKSSDRPFIGADFIEDNGQLSVRSVRAGSPAYEQGLNSGDQIIAIDGYRASQSRVQQYVGDRKIGDKVRLTVFRNDQLRDIVITLGPNSKKDFSFAEVPDPSDQQRQLYRGYIGAEL
jgi:predicted metalloprotease with PDZ domain